MGGMGENVSSHPDHWGGRKYDVRGRETVGRGSARDLRGGYWMDGATRLGVSLSVCRSGRGGRECGRECGRKGGGRGGESSCC